MKDKRKLTTPQLVLLSTGGIIGAGWLFSPFYGFQTAGVGVLLSWLITAGITLVIGLSFAEVSSLLPIVGGVSRFIGVTHNRTMAFTFIALSWLSYVVYLPIEAQSAIQYLGFWCGDLVVHKNNSVELSWMGLILAFIIIIGLTMFNSLFISRVAKVNSWVSIWKIGVPLGIALIFIFSFGNIGNVIHNMQSTPISFENVLLAVTGSGLAFAFAGFQNGLVFANSASHPKKAIPYSLFFPILIGGTIYFCLSLAFISCLSNSQQINSSAVAPLLALVALFGLHTAYAVLFIDAIIAPLGTANVFTATTSRVLFGLASDFLPNSILMRVNQYSAPVVCLWISAFVGACFLLPFPTWKELVSFLSSVTVFAYLAGPLSLIILRQVVPTQERSFKVPCYRLIGYAGFAGSGLLIYWSGYQNLFYLSILLIIVIVAYPIVSRSHKLLDSIKQNWILVFYMLGLTIISHERACQSIPFPLDNIIVLLFSFLFCYLLLRARLGEKEIKLNMSRIHQEIESND